MEILLGLVELVKSFVHHFKTIVKCCDFAVGESGRVDEKEFLDGEKVVLNRSYGEIQGEVDNIFGGVNGVGW